MMCVGVGGSVDKPLELVSLMIKLYETFRRDVVHLQYQRRKGTIMCLLVFVVYFPFTSASLMFSVAVFGAWLEVLI